MWDHEYFIHNIPFILSLPSKLNNIQLEYYSTLSSNFMVCFILTSCWKSHYIGAVCFGSHAAQIIVVAKAQLLRIIANIRDGNRGGNIVARACPPLVERELSL